MGYNDFLELAKDSIQNCIYVDKGSFHYYKERVNDFTKEYSDIIRLYNLTEAELFVMFMMLTKNYDKIQQCALSGSGTVFDKECVRLFDSFLSKVPRSNFHMFYRVDKYQRIGNFINRSVYDCNHYLTTSINYSILENYQYGVKLIIHRRLIGETKAHEVFKIYNVNNENQVNFERDTRFQIESVDKQNKVVVLTEL